MAIKNEIELPITKIELQRLAETAENILTAEGPFIFEITNEEGVQRKEVTREDFLEHSLEIFLNEVNGLIEKMEVTK